MSKQVRNVAVKSLTLGTPETIVLPKNYAIRSLILRLKGSVDVVAGTSAMTQLTQGINNIFSNIRVRRDGKDTLYALGGQLTYELNKILYGVPNSITLAAVTNASAVAVNATLFVPFENVRGVNPFDTLLKGAGLSSLDLLLDTSAASSMFYGGNGSVAVNSAFQVSVDVIEEVGANNFVFGDIRTYLAQKISVTAASNNFQIKPIAVGNYYKGFLLMCEDVGILSSSVITNIKLKSGSEVIIDIPAADLQDDNKRQFGITTLSTGVYYLDLMPDGRLNQALDVTPQSGRESLEFELVVAAPSGTCNISVVALEYIPPVIAKK